MQVTHWDLALLQAINEWLASSQERFLIALNISDRWPWIIIACSFCGLWFAGTSSLLAKHPGGIVRMIARRYLIQVCLLFPMLFILARLVQQPVSHVRPLALEGILDIPLPPRVWEPVVHSLQVQGSFPSDHAVVFGMMIVLMARIRTAFAVVALLVSTALLLLRVGLGFHWPSDVIAGLGLGMGTTWLMTSPRSMRVMSGVHRRVLDFESMRPRIFYLVALVFLIDLSQKFAILSSMMSAGSRLLGGSGT
ncbi:phosphatase PAP2 family protein [Candidatus Parcubacteria bacterium]|nr:MAG: phosphatase PAP2 family protein [Candidatus Parcubacteria bacterium]